MHGDDALQLYDVIVRAAGEVRALRLLVKNQSKRIDDLELELDNAYWEERDQ
jgi:hypothetical protein